MKIQTAEQLLGKKVLKKLEKQRNSKEDIFVGLENHTKKEELKLGKEIERLKNLFQDDPVMLKKLEKEIKKFNREKEPVTFVDEFFQ
jgi:hypothetical protein